MPNTYKVLGQIATENNTASIVNKSLTSNVVTMTTSSAHFIPIGQEITIVDQNLSYTVTNKALTSNVATLTIGTHRFLVGSTITVTGVDATFNGTYTVTSTAPTTVSYSKTASNVTSTASGGTVTGKDPAFNGTFTVTGRPSSTTFTYGYIGSNFTSASTVGTATFVPWTAVYTCPSNTAAVTSTLVVTNRGSAATTYQIAISSNTYPANKDILVYNDLIDGRDVVTMTLGLTLDSTNKYLLFNGDSANLSFNVFGMEIT